MTPAPEWAVPHLRPGEHVEWWGRPSLWGLVPIAASTLAALVYTVSGVATPWAEPASGAAFTAPGIIALVGLGSRFVQRVVRLAFTAYLVTDERFYAVTSFVTSRVQSVPLSRISTVSLQQGLLLRAFGLWTAFVSAYGQAGTRLEIPAMRDGERLLAEVSRGLRRGANASWLTRGD